MTGCGITRPSRRTGIGCWKEILHDAPLPGCSARPSRPGPLSQETLQRGWHPELRRRPRSRATDRETMMEKLSRGQCACKSLFSAKEHHGTTRTDKIGIESFLHVKAEWNRGYFQQTARERNTGHSTSASVASALAATLAATSWIAIGPDPQQRAADFLAVKCGDGGARLMAFHFDDGKAPAITSKQVSGHLERTDNTKFAEQDIQCLFSHGARQAAHGECNHRILPGDGYEKGGLMAASDSGEQIIDQTAITFSACGPLAPATSSNSTRWPSSSER